MKQIKTNILGKCDKCKKRTNFMYSLNHGLYCDKHWEANLIKQKIDLLMERIYEKVSIEIYK